MLQILRNKAQSIVIQVIVVIIALVFIFWGVGTNLTNNREAAIVVNDEEIDFQAFQSAYERAFNNIRNQFGGDVPEGLLESLGIKEQVIDQLIQETLLRQGAREMGLMVSKEEIQRTIEEMIQFQDDNGFSMEKYTRLLSANDLSTQKFEQSVELDLLVQKVSQKISDFGLTVTPYEVEELWRLDKSSINVNFAEITPEDYTATTTPDNERLAQWFTTVQDNYKTDPQIKLQYLDFSYSTIGSKIAVEETAIAKYFDDHQEEFTQPEQRKARHILFKTDNNATAEEQQKIREKVLEVLAIAKKDVDFSELAKKYSEGPSKARGGDLGLFSKGQMVKPFEDAVFSLKEGELSGVVETSFGFHIIKLDSIVDARVKPLAEVRQDIEKKLQLEQAKALSFQLANDAYEGIIAAGSLQAYLEKNPEIKLIETNFFSRNSPPSAIAGDPRFLEAAFSLKEKELSSLIETDEGYAICYAEAIKEPEVPELEAVKEEVVKDYIKSTSEEMAKTTATTLLQQAKEMQSLSKAADKAGLTIEQSGYMTKNGQDNKSSFPKSLLENAFSLSPKEPLPEEPGVAENSYYVYEFMEEKEPDGQLSEDDRLRYISAIKKQKQQQVLSAYIKNLRTQATVLTHNNL